MRRKFSLFVLLIELSAMSLWSESFAAEILKKSNISFQDTASLQTGTIWNYSKANNSFETRFATELFTFPKINSTAGLSTTYAYCWNLLNREEIQEFKTHIITEGIWMDFALPNNFQLFVDLGAGLSISKLNATSIEQKNINSYFNALALSAKGVVYRPVFKIKNINVCWNTGAQIRFFVEQDSWYQNLGLTAGITLKAAKK